MAALSDVIGLGILLKWKDEATGKIKDAEKRIHSLGTSVDETEKKTAKLQSGFAKLGKAGAVLTVVGLAGAASLFGVTKAAATYQDTLRDTMTMTGLTGQAFKDMERDLGSLSLSMSTQMGMSANEINKAFYQVLSSGAQAGTKQFTALADSALKLAKVVGMEPAIAVESLSDALHSFEMDVKDTEKMADVFFKTSMLGATTVPQMSEAMREASKVAVELKMPLSDVASVLTGFASKGIKGVQAGTAFRMVMSRLAAPVGAADKALAKLGVQVYDSTTKQMRPIIPILSDMKTGLARLTHQERELALKAIAGEEVFAKLGGLLASDLNLLQSWSNELKTGGVLQTAFKQKTQTLNFAFAAMRESLSNVAIVIGQQLLPVVTPMINKMAILTGKVRGFLTAHPVITKTVVLFTLLATTIALVAGPLLTVVGMIGALGGVPAILGMVTTGLASLSAAAGSLGVVISTAFWPVTAIVGAVILLYLAFKHNFLGIGTIVKQTGTVIASFFKGMISGIKESLSPFVQTFKEVWKSLKAVVLPLVQVTKELGALLGYAGLGSKKLELFSSVAKHMGKVIAMSLILPLKILLTGIVYLIKGFTWLITTAGRLGNKLSVVFSFVKDIVVSTIDVIKQSMNTLFDWLANKFGWLMHLVPKALISPKQPRLAPVGGAPFGNSMPINLPSAQPAIPKIPHANSPLSSSVLTTIREKAGSVDKSVNISQGAIVINATKVDEAVAIKIDRELAKLMERKQERR